MQSIEELEIYLHKMQQALASFTDKRKQLEWLVDYGKHLKVDQSIIKEEHKVQGCISGVYITGKIINNRMHFEGTSTSVIIKGYVAIVLNAMNDLPVEDVEKGLAHISHFAQETGLTQSVVPSRQNTIAHILEHMRTIILSQQ